MNIYEIEYTAWSASAAAYGPQKGYVEAKSGNGGIEEAIRIWRSLSDHKTITAVRCLGTAING